MPSCSILFCDKKSKADTNRRIFSLPKDVEQIRKWRAVLEPYLKNQMKPNIRICHLHFDPKDIETTFCHNVEGRQVVIERERARLLPNAIPDRNFPTEAEIKEKNEITARKRRPKKKKSLQPSSSNEQGDSDKNAEAEAQAQAAARDAEAAARCEIEILFDVVYNYRESDLPSPLWAIHRCPDKTKVIFSFLDIEKMTATKLICVDSDLSTTIYMDGQAVRAESLNLQENDVLDTINNILDLIDQT